MSFVIYEEEFYGGYSESLAQQAEIFNNESAGAILLIPEIMPGNYDKESFFKAVAALVSRRDITSSDAAADTNLDMGEKIGVKLSRKIGPIADQIGAFKRLGKDQSEISYVLGKQIGKAVAVDQANSSIRALVAAIGGTAGLLHDYSATGTITHGQMVVGMSKMGDAAQSIAAWVFHSKAYFDLVGQAITDKVVEVAGATIYSGNVATFGRPAIVIDSAPLLVSGAPDTYYSLGLVPGAATVKETEERTIVAQEVTGKENLLIRIQGEYGYNVGVKGFAWDVTGGGANPADATVATTTNWDQVATSLKDGPGVGILTQ